MHNSSEIREFIKLELKKRGIKKYGIKKTYKEIKQIKEDLLNNYKDKIEWIEIESKGTKYIVRIELRELKKEKEEEKIQDIVASKDGVIKKITAINGASIVNINDCVKKDDVLISGDIKLNEEVKARVSAKGSIYAEVWYTVKVEYPFHYREEKETGKTKNIFVLKFLDKYLELTLNKFKNKKIEEKTIFSYFPFSLVKQKQKEINLIDEVYTIDEVVDKALDKAKKQIESKLRKDEHIINQKILLINTKNSKIIIEVFFSVYENIGIAKPREE